MPYNTTKPRQVAARLDQAALAIRALGSRNGRLLDLPVIEDAADAIRGLIAENKALLVALRDGWEVNMVSLYDEEGVEGWRWLGPGGEEIAVVGSWEALPPIPDVWLVEREA